MTIPEQPPPTLEELRTRPVGRTGAELILRLREELLLVTWNERAGVFRVTDTEGRERLILGTAGPVHSAVVAAAIAAAMRWEPPKAGKGFMVWKPERLPGGQSIFAVMAHDFPIAIGLGPTEAAALKDLARIREACTT